MAEKDIIEKTLEDYNEVFADIVNVLLFNGERRINETDLEDVLPRSMFKADGQKLPAETKKEGLRMCEVLDRIEARGEARGEAHGEEKISKLINILYTENRESDILKIVNDKEYRNKLYAEFNIK